MSSFSWKHSLSLLRNETVTGQLLRKTTLVDTSISSKLSFHNFVHLSFSSYRGPIVVLFKYVSKLQPKRRRRRPYDMRLKGKSLQPLLYHMQISLIVQIRYLFLCFEIFISRYVYHIIRQEMTSSSVWVATSTKTLIWNIARIANAVQVTIWL